MTRERVLVAAYACEPGAGSEAGIGWSWTREIARRHDTWLITRANNVAAIERAARDEGLTSLHVEGFDLPRWMRFWKRGSRGALAYAYLWHLAIAPRARALDTQHDFDLVHHVTFGSTSLPSGLALVDKPFVWGPLGRHPRVADAFLDPSDWIGRIAELVRDGVKDTLAAADPWLARTRARADLILSIGTGHAGELPHHQRDKVLPFLACGTELESLPASRFERRAAFEVLYAGRLVDLKGVRLVVEAFAQLALHVNGAQLTIVGEGPRRTALERHVRRLGLEERVRFTGRLPRAEVLAHMRRSDVFLFPSFEGAGMVVVEAMATGNCVVCLDCGGPGEMVDAGRGVKVAVEKTFDATAGALARALELLHDDEELRRRLARSAERWARDHATWEAKGRQIPTLYARAKEHRALARRQRAHGGGTLHEMPDERREGNVAA